MRKHVVAICAVMALALAILTIPAKSQIGKLSPLAHAMCMLPGGKMITIDYYSPRMRGRKVYGDLVPWDKVWRAGAEYATTFVPTADVNVGGKLVPAGSYTIFTVPTATKWTLIVQKTTGEWGIPYPPQKDAGELLRTDMNVSSFHDPLENFTIGFDQIDGGCKMYMDWETTRASVDITVKK